MLAIVIAYDYLLPLTERMYFMGHEKRYRRSEALALAYIDSTHFKASACMPSISVYPIY